MTLFEKLFTFRLTKETASATTAGFCVCTDFRDGNLRLAFSGYSEKLLLVAESAMKTLRHTLENMDEELFEMLKKDKMKSLKNVTLFPHCLQEDVTSKLLRTNFWAVWDYEREVDKVKVEDSKKLAEKFFSDAKIQVLVQGNVERSGSFEIVNLLKAYFANEPTTVSGCSKGWNIDFLSNCHPFCYLELQTGHSRLSATCGHECFEVLTNWCTCH